MFPLGGSDGLAGGEGERGRAQGWTSVLNVHIFCACPDMRTVNKEWPLPVPQAV